MVYHCKACYSFLIIFGSVFDECTLLNVVLVLQLSCWINCAGARPAPGAGNQCVPLNSSRWSWLCSWLEASVAAAAQGRAFGYRVQVLPALIGVF